MKRMLMAAALFTAAAGSAFAGPRNAPGGASPAPILTQSLTAKQRGEIARTLVNRWAHEIRGQGGDVRQWATKLGRFVGTADAANALQASNMPTYQTMMGVLQGQPLGSDSIQTSLTQAANFGAAKLGSTISDTTYTPLPNGRCRVADSRVIASPITAGVTRGIDTEDITSYVSQGGNGTFANGDGSANCGIPSFATALAVSVTVLSTGSEGFFKIFENGKPFQTGSTVYYTGTVSASNDVIVTSCQSCALELSIYASSTVNYVIDVVGYFIPPQATELQCVETANTDLSISAGGGVGNANAPACPAGYTQTATNCETTSWLMPIVYFQSGTCSARNGDSVAQTLRASRTCCRVPGR